MAPPSSSEFDVDTDVLIVGAGPVGLLMAYQLSLFSLPRTPFSTTSPKVKPISVHIIEAHPRPLQQHYGRAVTFWPRSMELLDQLRTPDGTSTLAEDIAQQCYAVRHSVAYNDKGEEKQGAWGFVEELGAAAAKGETRYGFASVLRQKFVEEIFRKRLSEVGVEVKQPHRFEDMLVDESVVVGELGRVRSRIVRVDIDAEGREVEQEYFVKSRYVIGCDGSRTKVRGAAGIESSGDRTEEKWVRIDGVLKQTTMPKPRCYGAIESKVYGNILWIPLDHGATRLGYAFREERRKQYSGLMNEEVFIKEAMECVKPFSIEYERVDWASVYSVGQRVAKSFFAHGCIFLAGDSCHTHSSGAGQGMNAGVNDALNLGWKLAGVLIGRFRRNILDTYDQERRPNAERLIEYDEDISMMVSGRWPKGQEWEQRKQRGEDVNEALTLVLKGAKGFNSGLTLNYGGNEMVWKDSGEMVDGKELLIPAPAEPGFRAPDVKLARPALWSEVWLQNIVKNVCIQFDVVLFLGKGEPGRESFKRFKAAARHTFSSVDNVANVQNGTITKGEAHIPEIPVGYITIFPQTMDNGWHDLRTDPLGRVYYDGDGSAGQRYGINVEQGSVVVIRPDTWIGAKLEMDANAPAEIFRYVSGLMPS
jgi:phenol 2-monooxygenase (NADPH)